MQPGLDRYPPYRVTVQAQPQAVYVFKAHSAQTMALEVKVRQRPQIHVIRAVIADYVVYQANVPLHTG